MFEETQTRIDVKAMLRPPFYTLTDEGKIYRGVDTML